MRAPGVHPHNRWRCLHPSLHAVQTALLLFAPMPRAGLEGPPAPVCALGAAAGCLRSQRRPSWHARAEYQQLSHAERSATLGAGDRPQHCWHGPRAVFLWTASCHTHSRSRAQGEQTTPHVHRDRRPRPRCTSGCPSSWRPHQVSGATLACPVPQPPLVGTSDSRRGYSRRRLLAAHRARPGCRPTTHRPPTHAEATQAFEQVTTECQLTARWPYDGVFCFLFVFWSSLQGYGSPNRLGPSL